MEPRTSRWEHSTAMALAATEYDRGLAHLRRLAEDDWSKPTACSAWDVHQMVAHMLGMAEMVTSLREMVRQQRLAARRGGGIDNLTQLQVDEHADWSPERIVERFGETGPRAVTWRRRVPRVIRNRRLPELQRINGADESWTLGFLFDVILTRDPWMHRTDLALATQTVLELTPEHDGFLVAGVVEEWADRHGKDFDLTLTGPAGGHWTVGVNGPVIELDAIDYCRVLSGRRGPVELDELLSTEVPF